MKYLFAFLTVVTTACRAPEEASSDASTGVDQFTGDDSNDSDVNSVHDTDQAPDPYIAPCPATGGTWASCVVDRRLATGYSYPQEVTLTEDISDANNEPWVYATAGNLAGHSLDGLAFVDFSQEVTGGLGYLCVENGQYGPCPEYLDLPKVDGFVTALAIEDFDGDGFSDMFISAIDLHGMSLKELGGQIIDSAPGSVPGIDTYVSLFSQTRGTNGTEPLHWVDRTQSVGLEPLVAKCVYINVQATDLNADGRSEVVFGGVPCPPLAFEFKDGKVVRSFDIPAARYEKANSQTGVFFGPQDANLDRTVYLVAYTTTYVGGDSSSTTSGSSCWFGHGGNWEVTACPNLDHTPMGFTQFDPDQNGLPDIASSDIGGGDICTGNDSLSGMFCWDDSWKLPEAHYTLQGYPYHSVSWSIGAWDNNLVYVNGYEHAIESLYGDAGASGAPPLSFHDWPQQLQLFKTNDYGNTYERVHLGAVDDDVQERGLITADFNFDGCLDLMPLPVGYTDIRLLSNGNCEPGAQTITLRNGNFPAYGAYVVMVRDNPSGGDDLQQGTVIASGGGYTGFGPPVLSVTPDVKEIIVQWTTGQTTHHVRQNGKFPVTLTPTSL